MGTVQMNIGEANSWMNEIAALNNRLQGELTGVNESVQTIGNDASGSVVGGLIQRATDMINSTTELVRAFGDLVGAVADVISQATGLKGIVEDAIKLVGTFF